MLITMIDPPEGWKYGFPKPFLEKDGSEPKDTIIWLIEQGYPKKLIDSYGNQFFCRYWEVGF
jgi:hypothetical protein